MADCKENNYNTPRDSNISYTSVVSSISNPRSKRLNPQESDTSIFVCLKGHLFYFVAIEPFHKVHMKSIFMRSHKSYQNLSQQKDPQCH